MKIRKLENRYIGRMEKINKIAKSSGWILIRHRQDIMMLCYYKNGSRINLHYAKEMTVVSYIDHPRRGQTQLVRKSIVMKDVADIFKNPRTHTGKGKYGKG